ncbi:hypothetical protein [Amycolatopsis japonica]
MSAPESLATRVRRGVALLDEKVPGWHQRIDVEELVISSSEHCILGQLFGLYSAGTDALKLTTGASQGFDLRLSDPDSGYAILDRLWQFVVRSRQEAARDVYYAQRDGDGFDLVYRITPSGDVTCWSERYGWQKSKFGNLNEDSEYDRAHFADHLVRVSVDELPVGAR